MTLEHAILYAKNRNRQKGGHYCVVEVNGECYPYNTTFKFMVIPERNHKQVPLSNRVAVRWTSKGDTWQNTIPLPPS